MGTRRANKTSFKKGQGGRPAGIPNKFTKTVKDMIFETFTFLQQDESKPWSLTQWAQNNPTEFYKISSKLIPTAVEAEVKLSKLTVEVVRKNSTANAE